MPEVTLDQGTLRYTDSDPAGTDRPVVVLVHGLLVDGTLWRDVLPTLVEHARVLVPDLPLGSHRVPLRPDADLSPPGVAKLIADFLAALELHDVTLVGNDTGGAMCQLVLTRHPERLGGIVLTNCDTHENFLPPIFRPLQWLGRAPALLWLVAQPMRVRALRQMFRTFTGLTSEPVDPARLDSWLGSIGANPGVRHDVAKVLAGIDNRYTLEAATRLREFPGRAMIVWGRRDRYFTPAHAERIAGEFAGAAPARLEWLPNSRTFVPVDAPAELSALLADFVRSEAPSR
jgi:pimeloyl-ACP methyl ester carboxylesterase